MIRIRRSHMTSDDSTPEGHRLSNDQRIVPYPLPDTGKRATQPKIEPSAKPPRHSPPLVWKKPVSESKGK